MKRAIREYFEERAGVEGIESGVLLKIRENRLRRWKLLSLLLLFSNLLLLALLGRGLAGGEYRTMSAGQEVHIKPEVKFGELDRFLKEKNLYIKGPLPEGSYLIEGQVSQEELRRSGLFIQEGETLR